jgi:hypothetical protein
MISGAAACGRVEAELDASVQIDASMAVDARLEHDSAIADAASSDPPKLTVSPSTFEFGPVALASPSSPATFTFSNSGGQPATGCSAPQKSGDHASEFQITSDSCGTMDLGAGTSCTVQVTAKPTVDGLRTMTLSRSCAAGGMASTAANGIAVNRPMFIFVTTAETNGDLGGLTGADARCNTAGTAGSASGPKQKMWKALLSQRTGGVVNAKDRFVWTGPLFDMTGQMVTRNPSVWPWAATGTGGATRRTEDNVVAGSYAWTGSTIDGIAAPADCNGWTDGTTAFNGRAGETASFPNTAWFDSFNNGCSDTFFSLYCVSQ